MPSTYDLESEKKRELDLDRSEDNLANTKGPAGRNASASQSNDIHQAIQAKKGGSTKKQNETMRGADAKINKSGNTMKVAVFGTDKDGEPVTIRLQFGFLFDTWKTEIKSRLKYSIDNYGFEDPAKMYKKALSLATIAAEKEVKDKKEEWDPKPREH